MNNSKGQSRIDYSASDSDHLSEIAAEIVARLQYGDFRNAVNGFLSKYTKYEKYRDSLIDEGRWAIISCAIAASCHSLGNLNMPGDIVERMEAPCVELERYLPKKGKRKSNAFIPLGISRITDYIAVFRYVMTKSQKFSPTSAHHCTTSLKSIGLLMVKNVIRSEYAMNNEFEDTVHLLDELILPVLTTIFHQFSVHSE